MQSFSLLSPSGLWLLALLPPLVVLYILKVRRKRQVVSSTWLWEASRRDLLAKSPFKKLIAQLSLLLQILAVILLALILARPARLGTQRAGSHVAIVIDVSASMGAESADGEGRTRLDAAKEAARKIVQAMPPGSEAMVVEAGREARAASPLDRDTRRIEAAIDRLTALEVEGDLGAAVAIAVDRMKAFDDGRVVVITDGYLAKPAPFNGVAVPLEVIDVGAKTDNVGIVRADVRVGREPTSGGEEAQAFLLLANFGERPREVFVTMRAAGADAILDSRRLLIGPKERAPVVLSFAMTPADYRTPLVFDASPHDAMPVDDVAYGRVPPGARLPVVFAASDPAKANVWLERALASDAAVDLKKIALGDLGTATIEPGALLVVEGACPKEDAPGGDLLIVRPPAGTCWGVGVGAAVERPVPTSWESSDARMRFLTFDGVSIATAAMLEPASSSLALVRSRQGVLVADASTDARTVTLVGFDPGESDWPLKASFVLFMRNVTELARAHRMGGGVQAAVTGEPLRVVVPAGARDVVVTDPNGRQLESSVRGSLVIAPAAQRAGHYRVAFGGSNPGAEMVPVNLISAAESDLGTRAPLEGSGAAVTVTDPGDAPPAYRDLGWVLALIALAIVMLEVAYFTRRPRARSAAGAVPRAPDRRRA